MKDYKTLLLVLSIVLTMGSCSKEDTPMPQFHSPASFFMPADTATDATSQMRREFYSNTGSYLLFTDTIQNKYVGTDINGDDVYSVETLDLGYSVGNTASTNKYTFTYLTDYEQRKAMTDYLNEYVIYHFTGKIRPFSYFLCNTISIKFVNGSSSAPYASAGQRGVAVATSYLLKKNRTDKQKKTYANTILNIIIAQMAKNYSEYFSDFYTYSSAYYGVYWTSYGTDRETTLAKLGFIGIGTYTFSTPTQDNDLEQYSLATLQYTPEEWETKYAEYPVVIKKYKFVRKVLTELGFVYDN